MNVLLKSSLILLYCLFVYSCSLSQQEEPNFDQMLNGLLSHSVPEMSPGELQTLLKEGNDLLLLDTRSAKEFQISHLQNAQFIDFTWHKKKELQALPRDKKIVVYCTVGYRSEKISEKLIQMGFENVYNLVGGICEWVNDGNPVVNPENQPTENVHTYDESWGKWFQKGTKIHD